MIVSKIWRVSKLSSQIVTLYEQQYWQALARKFTISSVSPGSRFFRLWSFMLSSNYMHWLYLGSVTALWLEML